MKLELLTKEVLMKSGDIQIPNLQKNSDSTFPKINNLPKKYIDSSFENYQIYDNKQKELIDYLRTFNQENSLIFMGDTGTGKTHLAISLCKSFPMKKTKYVSASDQHGNALRYATTLTTVFSNYIKADYFFDACNKSIKEFGSKEAYIESLFKTDWLILDDLGMNNFTPAKEENLYLLIDFADQQNKKFIITTNFSSNEFKGIDKRITSRLAQLSKVKQFTWDDFRRKK